MEIQLREMDQRQASFIENLMFDALKLGKVGSLDEHFRITKQAVFEESVGSSASHNYDTPHFYTVPPAPHTPLPSTSSRNPSPNIAIERYPSSQSRIHYAPPRTIQDPSIQTSTQTSNDERHCC